jgi:hypothetical protein
MIVKRSKLKLAGQKRHKSLKEALAHVSEIMDQLHVGTTEKIKASRRKR